MFRDARVFTRFALGLPGFLRRPLSAEDCRRLVEQGLRLRERNFLHVVEHGIFRYARSPYRMLMQEAGIELEDVRRLAAERGVEGTLEQLLEAGVYVSYEEFKGLRAIERPGFTRTVAHEDFDNPLLSKALSARERGARGTPRRMLVDLDHLAHEAAYHALFLESFGLADRPMALWRPAPAGRTGLKRAIGYSKLGRPVERWFSQTPVAPRRGELKEAAVLGYARLISRLVRVPIQRPRHVPMSEAVEIARWLAGHVERGTPAVLNATASAGTRVCLAALEHGIDIRGSALVLGGEPYTEAKARIIADAEAQVVASYSVGEVGHAGVACATPHSREDLHVYTDKLAVIQHQRPVGTEGSTVAAFLFTTLVPSCPKLMLNVEVGDYGKLGRRSCGCLLGEIGFDLHVSDVRSYEKLNSEGVMFLGDQLMSLVEDVLPRRFGGAPTDFQIVEEEEVNGLAKVVLIISPRLGALNENAVADAALDALAAQGGPSRLMSELWRESETLRVARREPYTTAAAKILPLHLVDRGARRT
jgi:hypothetical protein